MDFTQKLVEVARFTYVTDARMLASLLDSEGIYCHIRNEFITQITAGFIDMGGARVEVPEDEVQRVLEIMKEQGYEIPDEEELPDGVQKVSGWTRHIPFLRKLPLEKQILFFFLLIAILLTALVYASKLLA